MAEPLLKHRRYTYAEYLEALECSDERLIFWDGEIVAMTADSITHNTIATNLIGLLGQTLRGRTCRAFVGNQKLRSPHSERAVFADGMGVCGSPARHPEDATALSNPTVVFEVLSKSTEAFDRGDKFAYYRTFPSMRAVVLISQHPPRAEVYHRDEHGFWSLRDLGPTDTLDLPEVEVQIPLGALYEGVEAPTG